MMSGIEAGIVAHLSGETTESPPPHPQNQSYCTLERRKRERAVQRDG